MLHHHSLEPQPINHERGPVIYLQRIRLAWGEVCSMNLGSSYPRLVFPRVQSIRSGRCAPFVSQVTAVVLDLHGVVAPDTVVGVSN